MSSKPIVAAFDFDGTLTYRDTLLPFLQFLQGSYATYKQLFLDVPIFTSFLLGLTSRQEVKEKLLTQSIKGKTLAKIKEAGNAFAQSTLPYLVKTEGVNCIQWHLQQRHRCVLISANLDLYLIPWATQMGFHDIICSECMTEKGILTGTLVGKNCWGSEKTRRLDHLLGPRNEYLLYAYGNSRGDHELLNYADYSFYRSFPRRRN